MAKDRSVEVTISEKEYTLRMRSASTQPEDDSPGDSESDAGSEFEMGLEFLPNDEFDPEESNDDAAAPVFVQSAAARKDKLKHAIVNIPETAKVISSELPSPWMDIDKPTESN